MNCTRNCLYQGNGECGLKLTSSDATSRCPLVPEDSPADAPFKHHLTQADHIRSMTDEELADFLDSVYCHGWSKGANDILDDDPYYHDWLKQPYKEESE